MASLHEIFKRLDVSGDKPLKLGKMLQAQAVIVHFLINFVRR